MAHNPVPLAIGGGDAIHTAEVMRKNLYIQYRGQEGVVTSDSCLVTETSTAGPGILVAEGEYVITSRYAGSNRQSYSNYVETNDTIGLPAVPPGSPRSDLVFIEIMDPYPSGGVQYPYPGDPTEGPYVRTNYVTGVPANTISVHNLGLNYTAIPLCRIDRPANSATITNSMIKDLRSVVNPFAGIQLPPTVINNYYTTQQIINIPAPIKWYEHIKCVINSVLLNTNNIFINWPNEANWNIIIPHWATRVNIICHVTTPALTQGDVTGEIRLSLDGQSGTPTQFNIAQIISAGQNAATNPANRTPIIHSAIYPVPSILRGRKIPVNLQARMLAGAVGRLTADNGTHASLALEFLEGGD